MRPVTIPKSIKKFASLQTTPEIQIRFIKENYLKWSNAYPEVSVVIPAYNESKNILQTLASLTSNTTKRIVEVIVINNNSTDNTESLVKATGVSCIDERQQGITAARNAGLKCAKGKYILNADADAIYPPQWIEQMINPLVTDEKTAVTYGRFSFIPVTATPRFIYFFYEYLADIMRYINKYWREEAVNVYGFNSGFRREQGEEVEGFNHPPGSNEDGWLALKLRNKGFGKLHYVTNIKALVWTSDRRIGMDGGLIKGIIKRVNKLFFPSKIIAVRPDL